MAAGLAAGSLGAAELARAPVAILKLDDVSVKTKDQAVSWRWKRVVEYVERKQLKAGCGVVCASLALDNQVYFDWLKAVHARGRIEFWFHGWDHGVHEEEGVKYNEFNHRTYEDQKDRFERSLKLAKEKLGFEFATFGPGGGVGTPSYDSTTVRVMAEVPAMRIWLFPKPLDEEGRKLVAGGKVTILDRVWAVNIESKVGVPDLARLREGFAANKTRPYVVLQGHPAMWDDARFAEFEKIVEFLQAEGCVFMTPSEYVASVAKAGGK